MHMKLNYIISERGLSMYKLAKSSGVPYTTINDICNGKTQIEKCSAETIFRLAKVLDMSMESLLPDVLVGLSNERPEYEQFKSNIRHQVKNLGDLDFIVQTLRADEIRKLFNHKRYPESLYLLAMVDYLSRINSLPLYNKYNDIRTCKLERVLYPTGLIVAAEAAHNDTMLADSINVSIPEFIRFNIVETEVRDVA